MLVDDVFTTGATFHTVGKLLLTQARALEVGVLVLPAYPLAPGPHPHHLRPHRSACGAIGCQPIAMVYVPRDCPGLGRLPSSRRGADSMSLLRWSPAASRPRLAMLPGGIKSLASGGRARPLEGGVDQTSHLTGRSEVVVRELEGVAGRRGC